MKTATALPDTFVLFCPVCEEVMADPSGSHAWLKADTHARTLTCFDCKTVVKMPTKIKAVGIDLTPRSKAGSNNGYD